MATTHLGQTARVVVLAIATAAVVVATDHVAVGAGTGAERLLPLEVLPLAATRLVQPEQGQDEDADEEGARGGDGEGDLVPEAEGGAPEERVLLANEGQQVLAARARAAEVLDGGAEGAVAVEQVVRVEPHAAVALANTLDREITFILSISVECQYFTMIKN